MSRYKIVYRLLILAGLFAQSGWAAINWQIRRPVTGRVRQCAFELSLPQSSTFVPLGQKVCLMLGQINDRTNKFLSLIVGNDMGCGRHKFYSSSGEFGPR